MIRRAIWGGDNEGQPVAPQILDLLFHVHLGALRDAVRDLESGRGNKLGELLANLEPRETRQKELADIIQTSLNSDVHWVELLDQAKTKVNDHLGSTSVSGKQLVIDLQFLDMEFRKIVDDLRIKVPKFRGLGAGDVNQEYFEIAQNGLGDNNRICIATVLGDLLSRKTVEPETFIALLIEEPEAHLHPQLQNILFKYFNLLIEHDLQVFLTSHSPTITAKADLDSIIVLQHKGNNISALSLKKSRLDDGDRKHLHRFLDVTKAQLFFATGVILVEGISEALLLPVFAQIMGEQTDEPDAYDLNKHAVEIVNIDGVAFAPFAKLFNAEDEEERLQSRCVIITDSDSDTMEEKSDRARKAERLENAMLDVQLALKTFEHELFVAGDNSGVIEEVYRGLHPRTNLAGETPEERANDFLAKLESNQDKAAFAQQLALRLSELPDDRARFSVPQYLQNAIRWVTEGLPDN